MRRRGSSNIRYSVGNNDYKFVKTLADLSDQNYPEYMIFSIKDRYELDRGDINNITDEDIQNILNRYANNKDNKDYKVTVSKL